MKGYHQIEVSADEIFYTNLAFRTGVRQFYNIFTFGAKPNTFEKDETFWSFGYGIGTAPRLTNWLSLNVDVTANQVLLGNKIDEINTFDRRTIIMVSHNAAHLSYAHRVYYLKDGFIVREVVNPQRKQPLNYPPKMVGNWQCWGKSSADPDTR